MQKATKNDTKRVWNDENYYLVVEDCDIDCLNDTSLMRAELPFEWDDDIILETPKAYWMTNRLTGAIDAYLRNKNWRPVDGYSTYKVIYKDTGVCHYAFVRNTGEVVEVFSSNPGDVRSRADELKYRANFEHGLEDDLQLMIWRALQEFSPRDNSDNMVDVF